MSRVLKVSQSDYRLAVQSGGTITLDTGDTSGTVVITGNLDVKGTTSTIESTNTTIRDNIIQINFGQTGNGISAVLDYQAGLQIGRGNYSPAVFVFDERVSHYDPLTASDYTGTFVLKTQDGSLNGLQVGSIVSGGTTDLVFDLQLGNKVLTIARSTNYEARVLLDNHIPNRKFVTNYVSAGGTTPGMADVDKIYKSVGGAEQSRVQAFTSNIDFVVQGSTKAQISGTGLTVNNISLFANTITNISSTNLFITATTKNVDLDAILNLNDQPAPLGALAGKTKLYSASVSGPGKTGLFFTNLTATDELVAKNRALLFSMLF
jgi:hypothetical protein